MNSIGGPGGKDPALGTKEITEENVEVNVRRIVNGLRASTCLFLAERMKEDKQAMTKIIKGLGTGSYTRDLKSPTPERKHFFIDEIKLFNQIDGNGTTEERMRIFNTLIQRLVQNECHSLARNLVEAIFSRANTVRADLKSRSISTTMPAPVRRPRTSVLDAVNKALGPVFGTKPPLPTKYSTIFPDDESDTDQGKDSTSFWKPPKK